MESGLRVGKRSKLHGSSRRRSAADEIDRNSRTGKEKSVWRIACSTLLGSLMVVGLFIALAKLAPMPGRADDDKDRLGGNDKDGRAKIEALRAQVESLQAAVSALQGQVNTLQTQLTAVQSNRALLLGQFVNVDFAMEKGVRAPET
jgi:peptidoglycan hydrolase CwlO-like protein